MSIKPRSQGQTAISVSLPLDLLERVDTRAAALGLNRSQYLAQLARNDLLERGELVLREANSTPAEEAGQKIVAAAAAHASASAPRPATKPVTYKAARHSKRKPRP